MICTQPDEFIEEKCRWIAALSNGISVYQDDLREGCEESSAWRRLRQFVTKEKLSIINLHIQFRSHIIRPDLPVAPDAYFFCNKIVQFLGGRSLDFYVVGYLKDGLVFRQTFSTPELILFGQDVKKENEVLEDFLIRNYNG